MTTGVIMGGEDRSTSVHLQTFMPGVPPFEREARRDFLPI
jgi:hypothetical protein